MPRYYYTDPLKAAWMAREFGVEFIEDDYKSITESCYMAEDRHLATLPFNVHPDSLPIFKPKATDYFLPDHAMVIIWRNNKPFFMPEVER